MYDEDQLPVNGSYNPEVYCQVLLQIYPIA